jgi:hypothetical protein
MVLRPDDAVTHAGGDRPAPREVQVRNDCVVTGVAAVMPFLEPALEAEHPLVPGRRWPRHRRSYQAAPASASVTVTPTWWIAVSADRTAAAGVGFVSMLAMSPLLWVV